VLAWKSGKKPGYSYAVYSVLIILLIQGVTSCNTSPEPIRIGKDNCSFCKMTITDARYGAEVVTKKGKVYKFDDSHCVLAFLKTGIADSELSGVYFTGFDGDNQLLDVNSAFFFKSSGLNTPMGGNVAAFSNKDSLQQLAKQYEGVIISWTELKGK
jgi:copper chaperone NosL